MSPSREEFVEVVFGSTNEDIGTFEQFLLDPLLSCIALGHQQPAQVIVTRFANVNGLGVLLCAHKVIFVLVGKDNGF